MGLGWDSFLALLNRFSLAAPGPVLIAIGPWRNISLETYSTRLTDVRITSTVSDDLTSADVTVTLARSDASGTVKANVTLVNASGKVIQERNNLPFDYGVTSTTFALHGEELELWYPASYGKQPLYEVKVSILQGSVRRLPFSFMKRNLISPWVSLDSS